MRPRRPLAQQSTFQPLLTQNLVSGVWVMELVNEEGGWGLGKVSRLVVYKTPVSLLVPHVRL